MNEHHFYNNWKNVPPSSSSTQYSRARNENIPSIRYVIYITSSDSQLLNDIILANKIIASKLEYIHINLVFVKYYLYFHCFIFHKKRFSSTHQGIKKFIILIETKHNLTAMMNYCYARISYTMQLEKQLQYLIVNRNFYMHVGKYAMTDFSCRKWGIT